MCLKFLFVLSMLKNYLSSWFWSYKRASKRVSNLVFYHPSFFAFFSLFLPLLIVARKSMISQKKSYIINYGLGENRSCKTFDGWEKKRFSGSLKPVGSEKTHHWPCMTKNDYGMTFTIEPESCSPLKQFKFSDKVSEIGDCCWPFVVKLFFVEIFFGNEL